MGCTGGCCTCEVVLGFGTDPPPYAVEHSRRLCVIHGDRDPIKVLLDAAENPLPRPHADYPGCVCKITDGGDLLINEDCPIHWRQTPDE